MAEMSRTAATLRVCGDDLDPDEVTRLLGVEPSASARRGEARRTPSGRAVAARTGSWRLEGPEAVPGDLDGQIRSLLAAVTDDLAVWRGLAARHRCDVFCGLFVEGGNAGEDLEPDVLLALGQRGLRLGLDIYRIGD